jgi:DNA-binding protein H-NS
MIDLSNMSLAQLRDLQAQVLEQFKAREKDEIANVRKQILELARSVGMTPEEVLNVKGGQKTTKPVAARYRNPADAEQVWSGRGRQPRWVKEYVETPGNTIESLLID